MSEAYWIGGSTLKTEEGHSADAELARIALDSALKSCGINPLWLQQIHWLVEETLAVSELPALNTGRAAQFAWREQPMWGHHTLHAAARTLITRECDLLALGYLGHDGCALSLLASPRSVGRYNLIPQACLAVQLALPAEAASGDWWDAVQRALEKQEEDEPAPEGEQVMLLDMRGPLALDGLPGSILRVPDDLPGGLPGRINHLAAAMEESSTALSLLVDTSPGALLVSLLERV